MIEREVPMSRLAGKIAIVTGAARGLGASVARRLVADGAKVALADVLDAEGEVLAGEMGSDALYVHLDVASETDWSTAVAATRERFGLPNVLVNNAGIFRTKPFEQISTAEFQQVVAINQLGCFLGMRICAAAMREAGGGSIVNIASTAGIEGVSGALHYTASKHAVVGMTKVAALELGSARIRVNAVCPGAMATPLLAESYGTSIANLLSGPMPNAALGRMGSPDEIAATVVFLASDESSYTTGSTFVVDGGLTAGTIVPTDDQ
jgi:3alpha(or 20beta)-hydroxysteroid dehydrogenase